MQEKYKFKFVHFSSSEIYGNSFEPMKEVSLDCIHSLPLNDYATTKWVNEVQINNSSCRECSVILRLFNLYGPGEHYSPYRSLICRLIYSAVFNLPFKIFKGCTRSHLFIDDAINAIANIIQTEKFSRIYNIGSYDKRPIEEIANIIMNKTGKNIELSYEELEPRTTIHKNIDASNAVKFLKLKESICLQEGIDRTFKWMRKNYE